MCSRPVHNAPTNRADAEFSCSQADNKVSPKILITNHGKPLNILILLAYFVSASIKAITIKYFTCRVIGNPPSKAAT